MLLEALGKGNVGFLEEALTITRNPAIFKKVLDEAAALIPTHKDHGPKLKLFLRTLAARDDEAGLAFLEKTLTDNNFRSEAWSALDLGALIKLLMEADTQRKTEMAYRIAEKDGTLIQWKFQAALRLFSAEKVYETCHKSIIEKNNYWLLSHVYKIRQHTPDSAKNWDRRWGKHFINKPYLELVAAIIYNDDTETWTKLLDEIVNRLKKAKGASYQSSDYAEILGWAFINKHPKAREYYEKFIDAGLPKEDLSAVFEAYIGNP